METPETIRQKIDDLIAASNTQTKKSVSLAVGKNDAYIQQYIKTGSPVVLPDYARRVIAGLFQIDERELMTDEQIKKEKKIAIISASNQVDDDSVSIEVIDATACCGDGIENYVENIVGFWNLPKKEYLTISHADPSVIKMLRVFGDSMEPTLRGGDWVLVDVSRNFIDSDGLFLLRMTSGLAVKRIQNTISQQVIIKSDNPKYDNISASVAEVHIIGKVVYTLKAEKVG